MKVLFIAAANSVHTVRWVNSLSNRGHQITLVSLPEHKMDINEIDTKINIKYLSIKGSKGYYLNALQLRKVYKTVRPDVINVHYASGYGTLARVARLPKVLLSVWGSDVYEFPYESEIKRKILINNLLYAQNIASTSYAMAEQVNKLIEKRNITVTPFGVDTKSFKKIKCSMNEHKFTVGIVKSLKPIYGITMIIKAFAKFTEDVDDMDVQLFIYGKGEQKRELEKLCEELQIRDKVFFKGFIPNTDVPIALSEIDVVTLGSESESFGVSAVEAMACEIPVIATDVEGFKEVIENQVTGYLVPKNDYVSMAKYLDKLYKDAELRKTMGKAGRDRVLRLYDWEKNVDIMEAAYREIV